IVYDILNNLEDELELILRHKIQFPTVIYTIARYAFSFLYLQCDSLPSYTIGLDLKYCQLEHFLYITLFIVANYSITLLFLLRVRAIFYDVPRKQAFFTFLWVLAFGSSILNFFHARSRSLVEPKVCFEEQGEPLYTAVSIAMLLVFDTVVYIAISYRLFQTFFFHEKNRPVFQRTCIFLNGATLPTFSKSLFRDGQLYYLISLLTGSTVFVLFSLPSLSHAQYGAIFLPLYVVSTNIIACWVFRNAKL
ncbi:hypothetical protein K435DRAFT_610147, partial [Dendrothele bispora CBS 962.96]